MQLAKIGGVEAARIRAVTVVQLGFRLVASHAQFINVDDNDEVARIDVWRKLRLVFATQAMGERCSQPPEHFVLRVHDKPVVRNFLGFCCKGLHKPNPLSLTVENDGKPQIL